MPIFLISGSRNLLETSGTVQACNGIALHYLTQGPILSLLMVTYVLSKHVAVVTLWWKQCIDCNPTSFLIYLKALNRTRHALLSYTAVATSFKAPCWHTVVKCGFIIHWIMKNNNYYWGMTLFTITGHLAFHFCIAVANLRFHVHLDCENTTHVSRASANAKAWLIWLLYHGIHYYKK